MSNIILESLFATDKFVLMQQPIVDVNKTVVGYEILLRIKDATNKLLLSPGSFIATLENYNLQIELDKLVINKFFASLQTPSALTYHVNISPKSVYMLPFLLERFDHNAFTNVCFEITESYSVNTAVPLFDIEKFNYIRNLGITFSFDDFGTKYVNYDEIYLLRPNFIKVDMAFLKQSVTIPFYKTVLNNIATLAEAVEARCIVEGVEDEALFLHAASCGFTLFQGWYFGKPTSYERT